MGRRYPRGSGPGRRLVALELTHAQAERIDAIREEIRGKHWDTIGGLRTATFTLQPMCFADKVDANAFAEQQKKVAPLRWQKIKARLAAHKQIEALLTSEQRAQFHHLGPWWLGEDGDEGSRGR